MFGRERRVSERLGIRGRKEQHIVPYTSKYLLRRYLDPPNPPQTPSQKVLGGLGGI